MTHPVWARGVCASEERSLYLYHTKTGEFFKEVYWEGGHATPQTTHLLNQFLRDTRTGDIFPIHPPLLHLMHTVQHHLGPHTPLDIVCGFRSEKTNEMLRRQSRRGGVAKNSLHKKGYAVDLFFPKKKMDNSHKVICALQAGGVGRYSQFIHMDIRPRVVHWRQS